MKTINTNSKVRTFKTEKQIVIENKDNLDSRKNEEWLTQGDNVTHNEKPTKQEKLKKHPR